MPEIKTKTLHYKRAEFHTPGPDLSKLLQAALAKARLVGERREQLSPPNESPIWRLIGQAKVETDFVFGVLMRFSPGTHAQFVVDDENATSLTVEALAAPSVGDKKRELLESLLYFGVIENHLVLMQGGLRPKSLEDHLLWLLDGAVVLPGTNVLHLVDQPPKATRDKIARQPVRAINVGGALEAPAPLVPAPANATLRKTVAGSAESIGPMMKAIRLLVGEDRAARLDLDALAGSNIEYTLQIRYNRRTTPAGQKLMNTLGSALRHADDVDTTVELEGGGKLVGSDMRMTGPVRLETFDGLPSTEAVFEAMRGWLVERLHAKDVI